MVHLSFAYKVQIHVKLLLTAYLWKLEAVHHDLCLVLLENTVPLPSNLCS